MVVERYYSKDYFGEAYKIASKNRFQKNRYRPLLKAIYDDFLVESTLNSLYDDLVKLDWKNQETAVKKMGGVKATYIGSEYGYKAPAWSTSEFLRKTSLYADTVVLEDQILNQLCSSKEGPRTGARQDFHYIVDYVIEYITLEHLFVSDSGTPICTLVPASRWVLEKNSLRNAVWDLTCETTTAYASELFSKKFFSIDDLRKFLTEINDDNQFFSLVKKSHRLVSQDDEGISPESLDLLRRRYNLKNIDSIDASSVYEAVLHTQNSIRITDLIYCGILGSIPVTDYRATWNSIKWLMKRDNEAILANMRKKVFSKETLIISALQQKNMEWLGNVPINKIRELRERGELADLRDLMGRNIENIQDASDEDFLEVGNQVKYNIEQAFRQHDTQIKDLNMKYRDRYKINVPLIVAGVLGVCITAYQSLPSAIGLLNSITGGVILKTINDYREQREKIKELRRKPVAMLFDAKRVQNN